MIKKIAVVLSVLFAVIICESAFAQNWSSALSTGVVSTDYSKVGNDYTIVLHNLTGITGDPTPDSYDVIVWSIELFNVPAPETIISMPNGWKWTPTGFEAFEISNSKDNYYTPPALAPGLSYTFKFTSTSTTPANSGGPSDGSPGFVCHVAAVDSSQPGSGTVKWTPVTPTSIGSPTWHEKVTPVPEPGSLLALTSGLLGVVGIISRKRK
ncbi:MAG: PEP-CTERM sorting domain-containing protein [Armatimonadota bacterium]